MYFKKPLTIAIIFLLFKYNSAFNCFPCTCETAENSLQTASCSYKTTQINGHQKLSQIPSSIQTIENKEEIGELNFEEQNFDEINNDLSSFKNVEKIVFSHNLIKNIHSNCLNGLTLLRTLYLDNNKINEIPEGLFKTNDKIKYIFLHNNNITLLRENLFGNLPNLMEVHLNHNNIKHIENNCFVNVPELKTLDLSNNNLITLNLKFVDYFDALTLVYFDKNPWVCDVELCDVITTSLGKKWLHGRIPECYYLNGTNTSRNWEDLQILKPIEIIKFPSSIKINQSAVLSCEIHSCSQPTMIWKFNDSSLQNSSHCIEGHKYTLTNIFNATKNDEGLYTCFIKNCSFCGNASRYLTITDVNLNGDTTTEQEKNTVGGNNNLSFGDLNSTIKASANLPDFSCPICFIFGFIAGILTGIIIGIIIGILIVIYLSILVACCPCIKTLKCFIKLVGKLKLVVDTLEKEIDESKKVVDESEEKVVYQSKPVERVAHPLLQPSQDNERNSSDNES